MAQVRSKNGRIVQITFGAVRRRVDGSQALELSERLELRAASSNVADRLARSLSLAAESADAEVVLDEDDRAELASVCEEIGADGELDDELRWLFLALRGERLPWEIRGD